MEMPLSRRQCLLAPALLLPGCAARRHATGMGGRSTVARRARVRVAPERVIRTIVGLRPYRPSGFVVRAEKLGDTLVVHNYGHGGSDITLSWGTSKLAVDLGAPGHAGPVAVIG